MEYLSKFDKLGWRVGTVAEGIHYSGQDDPRRQKYIDDGYIPITQEEWRLYIQLTGGKNGTGYIRDPKTGKPTDAPAFRSIDEARQEKIAEFKRIRNKEEVAVIEYDGNLFDYDDKARERLAIARAALEDAGGGEIVWTTADNERVTLTVADFIGINAAAAERSNALHVKYNELKERVNAAETIDDVMAIEWEE